MVKAMAVTESLLFTASRVFGGKQETREQKQLGTVQDMMAFAAMLNG